MTFEKLSELWLEKKSASVKKSTLYLYGYCVKKYLIPEIGKISVRKLNSDRIRLLFDSFSEENSSVKKSTAKNILMILRQILKFAGREKISKAVSLDFPLSEKSKKSGVEVFDFSEQKKMMRILSLSPNPLAFGVILALSLGIRIGEACALRWQDIDFERGVLSVNGTVQRIGSEVVRGSAKSARSERLLPIPEEVFPLLQRRRASGDFCESDFIVAKNGKMTEPRGLRRFFADFCARNKIRQLKFHSLRHTFATRCIESGVDCKTVSELLGHADISTTLNLYAHPSIDAKRKCVNLVKLL